MSSNFRKRSLEPCRSRLLQEPSFNYSDASGADYTERMNDAVAQQHWAMAMPETVHVSGCTCVFCVMRSESDDVTEYIYTTSPPHTRSSARRSLPSFRSVMEVLYSSSCPRTPFPDPPSYSRSDFLAYPARGDDPEISPFMSSTAATVEGMPLSYNRFDPLAEDPSLTGVPSQGISLRRGLVAEPSPPIFGLGRDIPEEPLPTYSRFDQRRPRSSAASDILGPYPSMSTLRRSVR